MPLTRTTRQLPALLALALLGSLTSAGAASAEVAAPAPVGPTPSGPTPSSPPNGPMPGVGGFNDPPRLVAETESTRPGTQAPAPLASPPAGPSAPAPADDGARQVSTVEPECEMERWLSGPAMAEPGNRLVAGWEAHAEDLDGAWYRPVCTYRAGSGTPDGFVGRADGYRARNPPRWLTSDPPPEPVPVETLVDYARDEQAIPLPVISVNPEGETVVGLRTWVWLTDGELGPVSARAESGPNWAEVTATPGPVVLSASDAEVGSCATAPAWTPGAPDDATDCFVVFRRSSAGRPGLLAPITASMTWQVRLTTSDGRDEALPPVTVSDVEQVGVAQVQSVVG